VLVSALVFLGFGRVEAYSVLLGGLLCIIPNIFFSWRVFRDLGSLNPAKAARSLYAGEAGKFLLVVSGFALVFVMVKPLQPGLFFLAFIATLLINSVAVSKVIN